jgi:hypothetical protein
MGDLLEIVLEPLCDLIVAVIAAILGPMVFGAENTSSSRLRQGKIQTIFDGDPYSRSHSV